MQVLVTVNAAWNLWNFRQPLLEAILAQGHQVTILAPQDESVADLERLGCRFIPLRMDVSGINPVRDLQLVFRMRRHFRSVSPDVVLSYTIKNNIFGALAARTLGIPFVPNVTGLGTAFLSGGAMQKLAESLYRIAFRGVKVVFFQNADDKRLFVERALVLDAKARLLPGSGVNLAHFTSADYPDDQTGPIFLMIGRLLGDKGVFEFVEAARMIRVEHPNARFQILGAMGSENRSSVTAETVLQWRREGVVEYLGTTKDVRPAIEAAHCVVLPSYREGAPRTLIEAAAMSRPLIATDVPGCRDIVDDGVSGYLCRVKSADSLAEACRRMIGLTTSERRAMGRAGRVKMEVQFDAEIVTRAYLHVLSELNQSVSWRT